MISADEGRDPGLDAFCELRDEFAGAFMSDPTRLVATPSMAADTSSVAGVMLYGFTLEAGKADFEDLLRFVSHSAQHSACSDTRMRAMAIIAAAADRHAKRNRDERLVESAQGKRS